MNRARVCLVVLATAALRLTLCVPPASAQEKEAHYVGAQACQKCHAEEWDSFQSNPHHLAELDSKLMGPHVGCEACHGPGSLHVEADGKEDDPRFKTIRVFKRMKPDEASAVCQTCHKTGEQFYWAQSTHARNDIKCQDCHAIHAAKSQAQANLLVKEKTVDLCISCHGDKRSALEHTAHMPLREGAMGCVDCHNPHGSVGPHMIRAASNVELCVTCHMDKRGPFLYEHPPVRENCVTCHMPHGSNNDKVLAGRRPYLCQRCHVTSRHPSTLYDVPDLTASGANKIVNRSCTNCHSQIHGSNHPSGEFFLR
jgi:DmsE family decaheme c-type cytochrome